MQNDEKLIQEGRNQVLYLLLAIGDENVAHDHWHPDKAHFLFETRKEIVQRLKDRHHFPTEYPDFETYTYCPGLSTIAFFSIDKNFKEVFLMVKTIEISDQDYDRLLAKAGSKLNMKFTITRLLTLSDLAAADIRKWNEWCKAVKETNPAKLQKEEYS